MSRFAIATLALVALAAVVAPISAQESAARISVSHTNLVLGTGFMQVIEFNLDEPIICPSDPTRECAVVVTVENPAPEKVSIDNCIIKWEWDEWHQPRYLRVAAVNNFIDDPGFMDYLVTEPAISRSEYYSGFDAANITIRTLPRPSAQCSGTGDPHYYTFDNAYWHVYFPGRYVLYGSRQRTFEVQVATRLRPARHCGFAAREGNDVVVVWACNGAPVSRRTCYSEECRRGGFPKLSISGSSRHAQYVVEFASGAMIRADTRPYYMNMYATAPGQDYGNTYGICGNFNGNRGDDFNEYRTHSASQLKPEQIPSYDLFEWYPPTGPETTAPTTLLNTCEYEEPLFIRPILNRPDAEDITSFVRNVSLTSIIEDETVVIGGDAAAAEPRPISHDQAIAECTAQLVPSNVALVCRANIDGFDISGFITDCAEDLEETGDLEFIEDALEDMERTCAEYASRNQTTWEIDEDNNPVQPNLEIQEGICLHMCNNNGECVEGLCRCNPGFLGSDCSINTNAVPTIDSLVEPVCDTVGIYGCNDQLTVTGSGFWNSDGLICRIGDQEVEGFFLGSMEVACAIPILRHRGATEIRLAVAVSLDNGVNWVTADMEFVYYDGICQVCNEMSGDCGPNPTSCTIDDVCYLATAAHPENICRICSPEVSGTEWTWSYANAAECGPSFPAGTATATVVGSAEVDEVIHTVDASNSQVRDDTNNVITYTLTGGDGYFDINARGEIFVVRAIFASEIDSTFNNFLSIRATDSAGNVATTGVVVDILTTNVNPLFNGTYTVIVPEDTEVGAVLATVEASDANGDRLSYEWFPTDDGSTDFFSLDSETGVVTLAHALDYEDRMSFMLILSARDEGGQYHITEFYVEVTNVNEAPTSISLAPSSIPENSPAGTEVGMLTASDPDGTTTFTFTTTSTDFAVDGTTLVTVSEDFDYESGMTSYEVPITVVDADGLSYTQTVTVEITDVNEAPYNIQLEGADIDEVTGNIVLREDRPVDQIVATITFDEDDADQTVQCGLVMRSRYLEIFVNNLVLVAPLDYENTTSFDIMIVCLDNGVPIQQSEPATFTIEVTNVDDGPQNFALEDDSPIPEDFPVGEVAGILTAVDPDGGSDFGFSIVGDSPFAIGEDLGCSLDGMVRTCRAELVLTAPLDYESAPVVTLLIEASNEARGSGEIDIRIANVNEPVTGISWVGGANTVPENAPAGYVVGSLQVIDNDDTTGVIYTVELLDNTDIFEVQQIGARSVSNVVARVLVVDSSSLDYEDESAREISLSIRVTEPNAEPIDFTTVVEVVNAPLAVNTMPAQLSVMENAAIGTEVGSLVLSGNDLAGVSYATSLVNNGNGAFALSGSTIVVAGPINFEATQSFRLVVSVETGATPAPTFPISVSVLQVQEAPVVTVASTTVAIGHDVPSNTIVFGFSVSDEDRASEVEVTFSAASGDAEVDSILNRVFTLASSTPYRVIATRTPSATLDTGMYSFEITASDDTGLSTTVAVTINVHDDCFENECVAEAGEVCSDLINSYECCINEACIASTDSSFDTRIEIVDGVPVRPIGGATDLQASTGTNQVSIIVPAVIGGIIVLACLVLLAVFLIRKKNNDPASLFYGDEKTYTKNYSSNPTFHNPNSSSAIYSEASSPSEGTYSTPTGAIFTPGVANPLYEWYRPSMDRRDCTDELTGAPVGSFVVRDSQACPGWHMLGVRTQTSVLHEKIRLLSNGSYVLLPSSNAPQPAFPTVPELVNHYTTVRDDIPFVLTSAASNPMYGLGVNANAQARSAAFIPTDSDAPALPLKDGQKSTVAQIAALNEAGDLYTNTDEANQVMSSA